MLREINFNVFIKLLIISKLKSINMNSSVVIMESHQEGAAKGFNPNNLYYIAFCAALKAYINDFMRSRNTYK